MGNRPDRGVGRRSRVRLVVALVVVLAVAAGVVAYLVGGRPDRSTQPQPSPPASTASPSPSVSSTPSPSTGAGQLRAVAPDGNDDAAGTPEAPWRSLAKALPSLGPGDTLTVDDGTYDERLTDLTLRPGTQSEPIEVVAAPGTQPLIRGLLWLRDADYWHISGINVTWSSDNRDNEHMVKFDGGTGWSLTDGEIWGAESYAGILVTGDPKDWRLADLFVHSTKKTHGVNQDHLIYVSSGFGGGVIERSILTDSKNGRAIKIGSPSLGTERVGNVVIRYNTMFSNLGPSNIQLSGAASGNRIYRNIMSRSSDDEPNVSAYRLTGRGNLVYDNVTFDSIGPITEDQPGLVDMGGNLDRDPEFSSTSSDDYRPKDPVAARYGAFAPRA